MKKLTLLSSLVFMVLLSVSFVTVVNADPYTYTGDKPIYPAVYQALLNDAKSKSMWGASKTTVSDPNTVVIENVRVNDLLNLADFTLRISLENNVLTYQFSDIKESPPGKNYNWSSMDKFIQPGREQIFINYFNKEIPKVMENEALYAKAKAAADKSLGGPSGGDALVLQNPQKYLIYPAVGAAFNNIKESLGAKTANLYDIGCLDDEFVIRNCFGVRSSLDYIEYQIKISYKEGQFTINFIDVKKADASMLMIYSDNDIGKMSRFDTKKIADQLKTQIEKSLATADAYKAAKKAFFENNAFLSRALYPLTNFTKDEFVEKILKDEELSFSASVFDVKKNDIAEFKNYTAIISATLPVEGSSSYFAPHVTLYTSDSSLTRLKTGEKVTLSGKFVRLEERTAVYYFIITK
jgi:hypothetical protein